jgi:hypothetical protein
MKRSLRRFSIAIITIIILGKDLYYWVDDTTITTFSEIKNTIAELPIDLFLAPRDQHIHFRTYGDDNFVKSKRRLVREAIDTGWFTTAKSLEPQNLTTEFRERFSDILALPRGGGYWIWRFNVLEQTMAMMNEGDFLVLLDAGCSINKEGETRFREYIDLVNKSKYDMLSFNVPSIVEYKYTTTRLMFAFGVNGQENITHTAMYEAGDAVFQKGPHYRAWFAFIMNILDSDPWLITDKYNNESKSENSQFIDNRHDSSVMSLAWKKFGCVTFSNAETYIQNPKYPFYAGRIRE